ncbi:hypothetical protein [Devosia sp. XK-2]|uniref:hypothetical protein n=1 Tax=Devosia sp. XK-2 TaxID=3126689 RepID=UPI0030D3BBB8
MRVGIDKARHNEPTRQTKNLAKSVVRRAVLHWAETCDPLIGNGNPARRIDGVLSIYRQNGGVAEQNRTHLTYR